MNRTVTLYSRPDCHLCDEAAQLLESLRPELQFAVERVDIESDPALEGQYRWAIPVIAVEGREIARAPIRAGALEDALREAFAAL